MKETSPRGDGEVNAAAALHRRFRQRGRQRNEVCDREERGSEVGWEVASDHSLSPHPTPPLVTVAVTVKLSLLARHSFQLC